VAAEWRTGHRACPTRADDSDAGLDPQASEVTSFLASVTPVLPASFAARISAAIAPMATGGANR